MKARPAPPGWARAVPATPSRTVHNGIEYADMQMIAETYGIMRDGMGMTPAAIAEVFERWNGGVLKSYLIEISAAVSAAIDPGTDRPVLDIILDRAGQKGTGRWTAIEAQHLGVPATVIEAAVAARNMSARLDTRPRRRSFVRRSPGRARTQCPADRGAGERPDSGQDRLLRPGFRTARGAVAGERMEAADAGYRQGLARRLYHPVGDAQRHGNRAWPRTRTTT